MPVITALKVRLLVFCLIFFSTFSLCAQDDHPLDGIFGECIIQNDTIFGSEPDRIIFNTLDFLNDNGFDSPESIRAKGFCLPQIRMNSNSCSAALRTSLEGLQDSFKTSIERSNLDPRK